MNRKTDFIAIINQNNGILYKITKVYADNREEIGRTQGRDWEGTDVRGFRPC